MSDLVDNKLFKDLILKRSKFVKIDFDNFPLLSNFNQSFKTKIDLSKIPTEKVDIPDNLKKKNLNSNIFCKTK